MPRPSALLRTPRAPATSRGWRSAVVGLTLAVLALGRPAQAGPRGALPSPLRLEDVLLHAAQHRQEIVAARARARAAGERPAAVSGHEDPMVMPSLDHVPFMLHGVDASLMLEQRLPLSGLLGHRRRAAEAEARRAQARVGWVEQEVLLDAARAFLMLHERRALAQVVGQQLGLARQIVAAATARYAAGPGNQAEVLRAEVELARVDGAGRALRFEVAAAEAMLNASLGRPVTARVPPLAPPRLDDPAPSAAEALARGRRLRPELAIGRAEVAQADAEIDTMEAMGQPMALVRTGPAYTMTDGWGWMLTLGVSVPIWRGRYGAGIREARAMATMARADLLAMTLMVEGEAAAARHQVVAARERLLVLRDEVLPRARRAIDPALAAYAAGTYPLAGVLDASQALRAVEAEVVSAEFELGLAWARLHRASGWRLEPGRRR